MNEHRTMTIRQDTDVIVARSRVRDLARRVGLRVIDQARISLATSCLARALGLGLDRQGQIAMGCLTKDGRVGVQVVCSTMDDLHGDVSRSALDDARRMVDELILVEMAASDVQVILIKWAT